MQTEVRIALNALPLVTRDEVLPLLDVHCQLAVILHTPRADDALREIPLPSSPAGAEAAYARVRAAPAEDEYL